MCTYVKVIKLSAQRGVIIESRKHNSDMTNERIHIHTSFR